jgi:hypothetical protein
MRVWFVESGRGVLDRDRSRPPAVSPYFRHRVPLLGTSSAEGKGRPVGTAVVLPALGWQCNCHPNVHEILSA